MTSHTVILESSTRRLILHSEWNHSDSRFCPALICSWPQLQLCHCQVPTIEVSNCAQSSPLFNNENQMHHTTNDKRRVYDERRQSTHSHDATVRLYEQGRITISLCAYAQVREVSHISLISLPTLLLI